MKKILIICQCATNKGDRAVAEYLIEQLQGREVQLTLSTTEPALWSHLTDVEVIPMGYRRIFPKLKNRFLEKVSRNLNSKYYDLFVFPDLIREESKHKKCLRTSREFITRVQEADLVIVTGGHHVTSIRNPNALFAITYDIGLAALYAKRLVFWSQTIGPLEFSDPEADAFFGRVLGRADRICIRDANSSRCLARYPALEPKKIVKSYDSVFGFGNLEVTPLSAREKKVGVSIFNGLKKSIAAYPAIAKLLDHFVSRGYALEFFRMENDDKELADIHKLTALMQTKPRISVFPFRSSTREHLKELSGCQFFVGHKTHSVIMSLATATPLLSLCYHEKTRDFMKDYGLEHFALDDEQLAPAEAVAVADRLMCEAESVHEAMILRSKEIAEQVATDLRRIIDGA